MIPAVIHSFSSKKDEAMKGNPCLQHKPPCLPEESLCHADRNQGLFINLQAFKDSCKLNKFDFDYRLQSISP